MTYRKLGKTNVDIGEIGLGATCRNVENVRQATRRLIEQI